MDYIKLRRMSLGQSLLYIFVFFIAMGLALFLLVAAYREGISLFLFILPIDLLFFLIPLTIAIVYSVYEFLTVITITANDIQIAKPFGRKKHIKREEVTAFGLLSFLPADTKLFFCMESMDNIMNFYQANTHKRDRMFGRERIKSLKDTDFNRWRMAVGVYANFKKSPKVIYVYSLSYKKTLQKIEELWAEKHITTGNLI